MVDGQGNAPVVPLLAGEEMRQHDAVEYWENIQAALAHAGLLKAAMGLEPDQAKEPDRKGNPGRPWRDGHHILGFHNTDGTLPRRVAEANHMTSLGARYRRRRGEPLGSRDLGDTRVPRRRMRRPRHRCITR